MRSGLLTVVAITLLCTHLARAQEKAALKVIRDAKAATALVVQPGSRGGGTAFCIQTSGHFITNAHVLNELRIGEKTTLVLNPTEADEKTTQATVVRVDKEMDLALLKAEGKHELPALPIGATADLVETQQVTAIGYPFGDLLALKNAKYPSVSVNVARISSLRKNKGKLEFIQLDSQLNPGNSGGPVLDADGKVVGVVSSGVVGAGINFAIPANKLSAFLLKPAIALDTPKIPWTKRTAATDLVIRATTFVPSNDKLDVEVRLIDDKGAERSFAAKLTESGAYVASVIPIATQQTSGIPAEIRFDAGLIRCTLADQAVELDGKPIQLSQVMKIDRTGDGRIVLIDWEDNLATGAKLAGEPAKASFGQYTIPIDLTRAKSIVLQEPTGQSSAVKYTIVAKAKGEIVGEITGQFVLGIDDDAGPLREEPVGGWAKEITVDIADEIKMEFVHIPAGTFMMGNNEGELNERPVHRVTITRPFYIGKHEVTQEQWQAVMGNNPARYKGAKNPVESASWADCQAFMAKLKPKVRGGLRPALPTEAQWEYATRAGTKTQFFFGGIQQIDAYCWSNGNSGGHHREVGGKRANPWGLHDVYGNLWEWCYDWADPYPAEDQIDPIGPKDGSRKIVRGAHFGDGGDMAHSARRGMYDPGERNGAFGLRAVLNLGPAKR